MQGKSVTDKEDSSRRSIFDTDNKRDEDSVQ